MSKKNAVSCPMRKTSIGGQALMEGIMMRGPKTTAMAVRNTKGEIVIESFPTTQKPRPAICRVPLIRGVVGFIDSMSLGYKCLMRSAEISGLEELEAEMEREKAEKKAAKAAAKRAKKQGNLAEPPPEEAPSVASETVVETESAPVIDQTGDDGMTAPADVAAEPPAAEAEGTTADPIQETATPVAQEKKKSSPMMNVIMAISMVFAVAIMLLLFVYMPLKLYELLGKTGWAFFNGNRFYRSIFSGVLRVALLIGYMGLMCLMKDIRRTFRYHGAEHKTIFCYEQGLELTVENVRAQRRFHPRCGTSFLILMMLVSIVVGFLIPPGLHFAVMFLVRILLIPVIMGLGYELIKLCGRHDNWLTRIIAKPGVWLQHITVFEPDDGMIECAIAAMKEVIPPDESDSW